MLNPRFKVKYLEEVDGILIVVKEESANLVRATQKQRVSQTQISCDTVVDIKCFSFRLRCTQEIMRCVDISFLFCF